MVPREEWEVLADELTAEEIEELASTKAAAKAEALKKHKKKPKPEEEELAELAEMKYSVTENLAQDFTKNRVEKAEKSISLLNTEWTMENHLTMDSDMFDQLNRKVSVLDIDIGEMDVVCRADLDVPLTPYVAPPPLEE
jgi:hypothetical protein